MSEITTRGAIADDLDTLYRFEQEIVTTERPFDKTLKEGVIHYYNLAAMIDAPDVEVAVATDDGKVIGSGYARIIDSKDYVIHQQHVYLGFMFVEPDYRGRGVNKKIIDHLKRWAVAKGITEMRLEVYDGNASAVSAYEKYGFSKLLIEMRMGID